MAGPQENGMPILRPLPQRAWQLTPASTEPPSPSNPSPSNDPSDDKSAPPTRTRSILNLTSSTLFGIYSPSATGDTDASQSNTPFGTGSMTPNSSFFSSSFERDRDRQHPVIGNFEKAATEKEPRPPSHAHKTSYLSILARSLVLFALGIAYGEVATRLHEETQLMPVKMERINRHTREYLLFWGAAGVVLGNLLPWVDRVWVDAAYEMGWVKRREYASVEGSPDWSAVVRGVGAFIGMAFAIRKLPWESSMQASVTLALANPVLWFLVDRSITGFLLSTSVGTGGAVLILGINPDWIPSPTPVINATLAAAGLHGVNGFFTYEGVAIYTWVASVLFCSTVCFGSVGRILGAKTTT